MTPDYEGLNMLATALEWHMTMKDSNNMYAGHCIRMAPDYDKTQVIFMHEHIPSYKTQFTNQVTTMSSIMVH